jgi:hypothetical protein
MEASRETKLLKLQIASEHWRNTFACAMEDLADHENTVWLRYEDLAQDPEEELRRVVEAIDIEYDPDMIPGESHQLPFGSSEPHKWFPIRTDTNDKHLQHLDADMTSAIRETVGDVAERFGYCPPTDS